MNEPFIKTAKRYAFVSQMTLLLILASFILGIFKCVCEFWRNENKSDATDPATDFIRYEPILKYAACCLVIILIESFVRMVRDYFKADVKSKGFNRLYRYFMTVRFSDWMYEIDGEIHNIIVRKVLAITGMLSILFFKFTSPLYYMWGTFSKSTEQLGNRSIFFYILGGILCYIGIFMFLQYLRGNITLRMHKCFDKVVNKSIDIFMNYETVHSCGQLEKELDEYSELFGKYIFYMRVNWVSNSFLDLMRAGTKYILESFLHKKVFEVNQHLISTQIFSNKLKKVFDTFKDLFNYVTGVAGDIEQMVLLRPIINVDRFEKLEKETKLVNGIKKYNFKDTIELDNLSCFYTDEKKIYENFNLIIKKGEKVAITGYNGTGKSTLIKHILKLNKGEGSIRIDGDDINDIDNESYRRLVSYIPQDNLLFNTSILENIRSFDHKIDEQMVIESCIKIGVHEDFKKLGYGFVVGDRGTNLSFTQRQKILLARALLHDNPIIVIDELTFDEGLINLIVEKLPEKTVLMITHSMQKLKYFDRIVYFDGHSICDGGDFNNICNNNSAFLKYYSNNY